MLADSHACDLIAEISAAVSVVEHSRSPPRGLTRAFEAWGLG
jgi:hypothetical protein